MAGRARWTDERVERELAAFLAAYDEWPRYREWRAARGKRLHAEALARRSAREWAEHFGVRFVERAPGRPAWDEPRIRRELSVALRALAPLDSWPRREQLRAVAGHGLTEAIARTGGVARWAQEFEIATRGSQGRWDDARIQRELRDFLSQRDATAWPAKREFLDAGRAALLRAIYASEGTEAWAARMGVTWRGRRRRSA